MLLRSISFQMIILWGFFISCNNSAYENKLDIILGVNEPGYTKRTIAEDVLGFGEGFVIEKFHLTENTSRKFENHLAEISQKAGWESQGWIPAHLISRDDNKAIEMVLEYSTRDRKLNKLIQEIRKSIEREKSFFACYCKPDCENPIKSVVFVYDHSNHNLWIAESFF